MSTVAILSARGAFFRVSLSDNSSPGLYGIEGLNVPDAEFFEPEADGGGEDGELRSLMAVQESRELDNKSPILITGVRFTESDVTSAAPCLNNVKVLYSFGQNFGQIAISGEILLGPMGDVKTAGVKRLKDFFWKNRVSVRKRPINISLINEPHFMYLSGLDIMPIDPVYHILPFTMFGTSLDLSRQKLTMVNPGSVVITGNLDSSLAVALSNNPNDLSVTEYKDGDGNTVSVLKSETAPTPAGRILPQSTANELLYDKIGHQPNAKSLITSKVAEGIPLTKSESEYNEKEAVLSKQIADYAKKEADKRSDAADQVTASEIGDIGKDTNAQHPELTKLIEERKALGNVVLKEYNNPRPAATRSSPNTADNIGKVVTPLQSTVQGKADVEKDNKSRMAKEVAPNYPLQ